MRPRTQFSSVLFPAPLGPISPRIRPSSTCRLIPSSATVLRNALRRPRASMVAMNSMLLRGNGKQLLRRQAEALNGGANVRPLLRQEPFTFGLQQEFACTCVDKHAQSSALLHHLFIDKLLIGLQHREGIHAILSGDIAH